AVVGGDRGDGAARRGRSGRRMADAHRPPPATLPRSRGARPRPAALRGAGHGPHGRAAARSAVGGRGRHDGQRHRARSEHADRGALHVARLAPHRRHRARNAPARARRHDRARPRNHLRRRPRRRRESVDRCGRRARADVGRRVCEPPRRGRAGRRHVARRADGAHVLQHAVQRERVAGAHARRAARTGAQSLQHAHGLHDRRARGGRRRHHPRRTNGSDPPGERVAARELDDRLERYADVAVRVGANVGRGQVVFIGTRVEHAPLARALARRAYAAGARYVDVHYTDQHVRRAMIELGPDEALEHSPSWMIERYEAMEGNAVIGTTGDPDPHLLADLDGERVGRARMRDVARVSIRHLTERTVNWTGVAFPTEGWAQQVFGEPDVERLWEAVSLCTRLDEDDPVEAWRAHMDRLDRRAAALNELGLDRLTYKGPGTDFELGLLERSRFGSALFRTVDGRPYVANMPTEEVFATPDARRAEGVVTSTKPLAHAGEVIE